MQSDGSGFLQGTPLNDGEAEEQQRVAVATSTDVHRIAGDTRAMRRMLERAVTSPLPTVTPRGKDGRSIPSVVAALRSRDVDRIREAVEPRGRVTLAAQRDAGGRFVATGGSSPATTGTLQNAMATMARQVGALGGAAAGADRLDPTLTALREVRDVVSPVGRGFMALHNRKAERKKERWYSRILKAITGRKGEPGMGSGGDVGRGSFLGTFFGETIGKLAGSLPALLTTVFTRILAPVAAIWAGWQIGQWIGGKIYEWLDKSGIATKVFDAFDAVGEWFKDKFKQASDAASDFKNGVNEQTEPQKWAPAKLDASGRNINDERRIDRANAVASDGRLINDPRRVDANFDGRLLESKSFAQSAGRFVGAIKSVLGIDGRKRIYENADGSVEERNGGSVSWRNNNPGNMKFEYAGSADKTVRSKRSKAQALEAAQKRYEGVVDLDQFGNAIFASEAHGRAAKAKLLQGMHGGLTVDQMLPKYAVSDYSGTANHAAYAAGIYKSAEAKGLNLRGKKIGDMNPAEVGALLDGMKRVEGFKVGTTTGIRAASVPTVASVSIPTVRPASVPMSVPDKPAITQAAPVPESLSRAQRNPTVVISKDDVNQDVRDKRLAHIVTGGIGG